MNKRLNDAEDRRWSREYAACRGYGDEANPQPCGSPILPHAGNGRCSRCYQLHRKYLGQNRDIFTSINDVSLNGEDRIARDEEAPMVTTAAKPRTAPTPERILTRPNGLLPRQSPPIVQEDPVPEFDDYGFEVYTATPTPRVARPIISLRRDNGLYLNGAAFTAIGSPEYVELLYSRTKRILALRPVAADADYARPVKTLADRAPRYRVPMGELLRDIGLTAALRKGYEVKAFGAVRGIQLECAADGGK